MEEEFVVSVRFASKEDAERFYEHAQYEWMDGDNPFFQCSSHIDRPVKIYFLDYVKDWLEVTFFNFFRKYWEV